MLDLHCKRSPMTKSKNIVFQIRGRANIGVIARTKLYIQVVKAYNLLVVEDCKSSIAIKDIKALH